MGFGHLRAFPSRIRRQGPGNTSDAVARALSIGDLLITYIVSPLPSILDAVPNKGPLFCFNHAHFPIFSNGRLSRNQTE